LQDLHTDYPIDKNHPDQKFTIFSFFAVVALMEDTTIVVTEESNQENSGDVHVPKILLIPKGSVFFGRGDLVHSGNKYNQTNVRLHIYFDFNQSSTGANPRDTYFVENNLTNVSSSALLKIAHYSSTNEVIDLTANNCNPFQEIESLRGKFCKLKGITYKFVQIIEEDEINNQRKESADLSNNDYEEEQEEENDDTAKKIQLLEAQIKSKQKILEKLKKQNKTKKALNYK
jgi:hypothetical protein